MVRARQSRTADLFAREVPPPPVSVPPPRAPSPVRPRALWYAAVFPGMLEMPAPEALLRRLAQHAQRFTSFVSLEPPAALLLEIRGSLRLFGPPDALHARIDAGWEALGVRAQSAAAPTPLAALWLARAGERTLIEDPATLAGRLARLPLACTAWDPQRLALLRALGIRRFGELLRLPRAGLARRLGPAAVTEIDAALARTPAPRRAFVACARLRERCDFENEIAEVGALERALEPLIERCVRFLRERQAGVQSLELRLRHRALPATRLQLGFAGVTGDPRRLRDVFAERLSRLALAAPVRAAALLSGPLQLLSAGRDGAAPLIERLRARLGESAVYGICRIAEHRPEAAWRRVQELPGRFAPAEGASAGETRADEERVPRPVWLLREPVSLAADAAGALLRGGWRLEQGPERIESGWWDGLGIARDYYVARHAEGARLWVFQERRSKHWYLHGVFA